jgi:predicted ArsR family transcriptional regulator
MNPETKFLRRRERILRLISKRPGITGTELSKASLSVQYEERVKIIDSLIGDGQIRITTAKQPNVGRPTTQYWPVEDIGNTSNFRR